MQGNRRQGQFLGTLVGRFGDIDFKAADLDGFGENWPVDYAEIAPWFSKAERYMGVASTVQNRPSNPDGEYLPPMPWRCIDYIMQKGAEKIGVPYLPDRCAQLTVAHNGRPACHYCGNCSRGCDVGSFFSPTWFTIPDAEATKNLDAADECARARACSSTRTAWRRAWRTSIAPREGGGGLRQGSGARRVLCRDGAHHAEFDVAALAHRHRKFQRPARAGICASTCTAAPGYGYLPQLLGQPATPDNIADSTVAWMPRWQNLTNPREEKFIRGYSVYMGGGCGEFPGYYSADRGVWLDDSSATSSGTTRRQSALSFRRRRFPAPPTTSTSIRTRRTSSAFPQLRFHFQWGQQRADDVGALEAGDDRSVQGDGRRAVGQPTTEPNRPGTSLHETGVCRFGNDPKTSVTNKWAQTHDVPNLYICDASIFPNCTDKTTTMPIVAFAMRTCDHMLDNFKKGVHKRA